MFDQNIIEKAKPIRLAIFDIDGVFTTGKLFYGANGIEYKEFHVHDGQGIKFLQRSGVEIGIITARESDIVTKRMLDLDVKYVYQGNLDKLPAYEDLKQKLSLNDNQIAYLGDDLPDLPLIQRVGLGITVPNAPQIMKKYANWVTQATGGQGAVREVCELIMQSQGTYETIIESFLKR